ncbi:MAG: hypothetical protein R3B13_33940 [Polyangiaceae bacterium]
MIKRLALGLAVGGLVLGGCGSDDDSSTPGGGGGSSGSGGSGGGAGAGASAGSGGGAGIGASAGSGGSAGGGGSPAAGCPTVASDPDVKQALPKATIDVTYPSQTGSVVSVKSGQDLQAAIDAAKPGDTLELEAGATFTGPFTLPNKSGSGVVVIRTASPDSELGAPGTRVKPSLAPKMAKLVAKGPYVVSTDSGAHHYRLVGLEVTGESGEYVNAMLALGVEGGATAAANLPHDLIVDRCYLHADPVGGRRGVALNSGAAAVVDSYLSGFREKGADSQAIVGWDGTGPYVIQNNYLEGASENVMFGGADPSIKDAVPSDIHICNNHFKKDVAWKGGGWVVKNLFELKNARRVLVAGNVMEYNWADAQVGFAVLFTVRNQDGTAPWSTVEDVTFAYNVVRHTGSGVNILASDSNPSQETARLLISHNLVDDIDTGAYGGDGRAWQFIAGNGGGKDIKIDHNTTTTADGAAMVFGDTAKYGTNFIFTNNVVARGQYGVFGSGQGEGAGSLDYYLTSYTMKKNVFFGGDTSAPTYPADNFVPATAADVAFESNFALGTSSKYKGAGTDGKDLGADITALEAAIAGVVQP